MPGYWRKLLRDDADEPSISRTVLHHDSNDSYFPSYTATRLALRDQPFSLA